MPSIDPERNPKYCVPISVVNNQKVDNVHDSIDEYMGSALSQDWRSKCCRRGCKIKGAQVLMCSTIDCEKTIHETCYQYVTRSNKDMPLLTWYYCVHEEVP